MKKIISSSILIVAVLAVLVAGALQVQPAKAQCVVPCCPVFNPQFTCATATPEVWPKITTTQVGTTSWVLVDDKAGVLCTMSSESFPAAGSQASYCTFNKNGLSLAAKSSVSKNGNYTFQASHEICHGVWMKTITTYQDGTEKTAWNFRAVDGSDCNAAKTDWLANWQP